MKSLSYKGRVMQAKDISIFDMPKLSEMLNSASCVEGIEKDAYERGFEVGEKAGFAMGEEKAKILIGKMESLITELSTLKESTIKELEQQIVEVVVSIARKIILSELITNPEQIVAMTKEALMKLERIGQITIKINPFLHEIFMKNKPDILSIHPDVLFDIDPSAPQYGSVVIGPVEEVIVDIDDQIRNLIKEMGDRLAGNRPD